MKTVPNVLLLLCLVTVGQAFGADEFERIARQKLTVVPGLAKTSAPNFPDTALPWDSTPAAGFKPAEKLDTQQKLITS